MLTETRDARGRVPLLHGCSMASLRTPGTKPFSFFLASRCTHLPPPEPPFRAGCEMLVTAGERKQSPRRCFAMSVTVTADRHRKETKWRIMACLATKPVCLQRSSQITPYSAVEQPASCWFAIQAAMFGSWRDGRRSRGVVDAYIAAKIQS